ncbi:MAG: hypothetical protein ACRYFS_10275 [Janthinobacterium lividum]
MSARTRPPLLLLRGQEAYADYEKEFRLRYQNHFVNDILGNRILFREHMCRHVCFKPVEKDRYKQGEREIWVQERAEHIPWILAALSDPGTEIYPNEQNPYNRVNYLLNVEGDPENNLKREYFCVVAEWIDDKSASFITGFPVDRLYWQKCRRVPGRMYP